jgi:hypothetical protein
MSFVMRFLGRIALVVGSFGAAGCAPEFDHAEISGVKQTGLGGGLTMTKLDVPEGLIVKAHIVMWNDDKKAMGLSIRAADPAVIEVASVVNDRDYAFVGLRTGHTQVEFRADDKLVLTVDAEVKPQPDMPAP